VALLGLLAVLTGFFTCSRASSSEDGAIYAAAIAFALDRNDVLPDAVVYVNPSIERRTDRTTVDELVIDQETRDSIAKNLGRTIRFSDPDETSSVRLTLGPIEERDGERTVQVKLVDPIDGDGFVATYVLEHRGRDWQVVQTMSDGVVQPS
jgi:hypothetical protein